MEVEVDVDDHIASVLAGGTHTPGELAAASALFTLLGNFANPRAPMTPVIVRPSPEQIEQGSRVDMVQNDEAHNCAICQDTIRRGSERRTLTQCSHEFHSACIDVWFQQNVRCPICRHDIREVLVPVPTGTGTDTGTDTV